MKASEQFVDLVRSRLFGNYAIHCLSTSAAKEHDDDRSGVVVGVADQLAKHSLTYGLFRIEYVIGKRV